MTNCFNCANFGWKSDKDPFTASVGNVCCPHCKVATYCSESCRSEHWIKLHKFHCDIMRGAKELPGGKHDRDSCLACKEESEAAGVNNNGLPPLPCYLPNNFVPILTEGYTFEDSKKAPAHILPVQLGEMTGVFVSKLEQTLSTMLRLMKKMMMDKHPLWTYCKSVYKTIWDELKISRQRIWISRVILFDTVFELTCLHEVEKLVKLKLLEKISVADNFFVSNGIKEGGLYKPFETVKLLFGILGKANIENNKKMGYGNANKAPKPLKELKDKLESVSKFNEMWSQVLKLLDGRLAHLEDLKKAACYGDLKKPCWGCFKDFTVKGIIYGINTEHVGPVLMLGNFSTFSHCGKCNFKTAYQRYLDSEKEWNEHFGSNKIERCDFCGKFGGQRHRCITCHSKLYCGRECWEADQEIHKEFCKPCNEMEPWKVKDGFSGRKQNELKSETTKKNEKAISKLQDLVNKM